MTRAYWWERMLWAAVGAGLAWALGLAFRGAPSMAITNDRVDDNVVATAPWDENEITHVVYILDVTRQQLVATAVSPTTGKFLGMAARDITQDFQVGGRAGRPRFAMVAGRAHISGLARPIAHLLYIIDLNSGRINAYTLPFTGYQAGAGAQPLQILPVDALQYGRAVVRR
jgi:hypothetical protein